MCRRSCRALLKRSAQDRHAYNQQIGKTRSVARCRCLRKSATPRVQALLPSPPHEVCPRQAYVQPTNRKESTPLHNRAESLLERIGDSARAGALVGASSRGLPKTGMRTTNKSEKVGAVARCRCLKEISDSACAGALAEPSSRGLPKTGMRTTNKSEKVGAVARCRCLKEISDSACAGALAEPSS